MTLQAYVEHPQHATDPGSQEEQAEQGAAEGTAEGTEASDCVFRRYPALTPPPRTRAMAPSCQ